MAKEIIGFYLSRATPEEAEHLMLEFGKGLSFNAIYDQARYY